MKQILHRKGRVGLYEVPEPTCGGGEVKIRVRYSAISAGTEIKSVSSQHSGLLCKLADPQKLREGLDMLKREGLQATMSKARGGGTDCAALGYSLAGTVVEAGVQVRDLPPGTRVAAAGAGRANHAEVVTVPRNLVVPVPNNVDLREASTVTIGAIALQAVRRATLSLGERVAVIGVGILGQLVVRLCVLSGTRVVAIDVDERRLGLAMQGGATATALVGRDDLKVVVNNVTNGRGADVVIFAAQTVDPEVLSSSLALCRRKARCVMLGEYGQIVRREDLYAKEIDFLISCSYGPGRYDRTYEEEGVDYPFEYVRWTENRNMAEFLELIDNRQLALSPLIEREATIDNFDEGYSDLIRNDEKPLIVLLSYPPLEVQEQKIPVAETAPASVDVRSVSPSPGARVRIAVIGAGNFARGMHLPNLAQLSKMCEVRAICDHSPVRAAKVCQQFKVGYATTDIGSVLADQSVDAVLICTRHDSHAALALLALQSGKHVFVEKPLCLSMTELCQFEAFFRQSQRQQAPIVMVDFNRRFAPMTDDLKRELKSRTGPLFMNYRINAERLPQSHWIYSKSGGGRVIGEVCHFLDYVSFLAESEIEEWSATGPRNPSLLEENVLLSVQFEDGSAATITYQTAGASGFPKELVELHWDGKSAILDNYKRLAFYRGNKESSSRHGDGDKGHLAALTEFLRAVQEKTSPPIPLHSLFAVSQLCLEAATHR